MNNPSTPFAALVAQQNAQAQQAANQGPQASSSSLVHLTEAQIKEALPTNLRSSVTQSLVDLVNNVAADPIMAENIRNNFLSYTAVLREGKFKTEDYLNAVAYVSYKLMGYTNEEAYSRTFPQRYATLLAKGTNKKDISSYVHAFHKGKLVNIIMEQSLVPSWVLNQDLYQKALNVQAELMTSAASEKVRTDAANSILTHLAKPKDNIQINLGQTENSGMKEMREMLQDLAKNQKTAIDNGQMKTIDVAAQRLPVRDNNDD